MQTFLHNQMTIELHNEEISTMRELVRLAHERLLTSPGIQMKGVPLKRQAGLVGPDLCRVEEMLKKLGNELGIDCSSDKPDNEASKRVHIASVIFALTGKGEQA